jgi:hypothetical protein
MSISVNPTFLAKGIDHNELVKEYNNGKYKSKLPKLPKIKDFVEQPVIDPIFDADSKDPIFYRKDLNGTKWTVVSTGVSGLISPDSPSMSASEEKVKKEKHTCNYCKSKFTHNPIGYPIKYEIKPIIKKSTYKIFYIFWVEDFFCSFECTLGYVRLYKRLMVENRYIDSAKIESDIHFMYRLVLGDKKAVLTANPKPKLLKNNAGSISLEKWKDKSSIYLETPNIKLLQTSVEHIKKS